SGGATRSPIEVLAEEREDFGADAFSNAIAVIAFIELELILHAELVELLAEQAIAFEQEVLVADVHRESFERIERGQVLRQQNQRRVRREAVVDQRIERAVLLEAGIDLQEAVVGRVG